MIYVNGNLVTDADSLTLHDYLSREGYSFAFIAVECNGQIIPKSMYKEKILKEDDHLEVVSFVGGGWYENLYKW